MRPTEIYRKIRQHGLKESFRRLGIRLGRIKAIPHIGRERLIIRIVSLIEKWGPWKDQNKSTLYAVYDLATTTPTFDIGQFMPLAELERRKKDCSDMVLVVVKFE